MLCRNCGFCEISRLWGFLCHQACSAEPPRAPCELGGARRASYSVRRRETGAWTKLAMVGQLPQHGCRDDVMAVFWMWRCARG